MDGRLVRKKLLAIASLTLTLSACGSPSDEDVLTDAKIQSSQSAPELPDVQLSENPEPPPAPPTPPPEEALGNEIDNAVENEMIPAGVPGTIPPAFQALWAMAPSDCRPGDVTGNAIMITPEQIISADAVGSLQGVLGDYPGRFEGRFVYDSATEVREQLALNGNRNVLVRTSGGQQITYRRCAAGRPTG
jgi:hypothetical protein